MASRIIFEEDIEEENIDIVNGHKACENIPILSKTSTDDGNSRVTDNSIGLAGNITQDKILSNVLSNTQPTEKEKSYEILEIDDAATSYNGDNTNSVNKNGNVNTNKYMQDSIQMHEGKNEQDKGKTETNSNKSNEMGNTDQQSQEKSHEVPVTNENLGVRVGGNLGQENVMVRICQSPVDAEKGHHAALKRRLKRELEQLGADVDRDDVESKFDIFGDDTKIYRKYRLRKTEQKISYKEPADFKPKRHNSTESDEPVLLECPVCCQGFDTKRALNIHQRCHGTVQEFTCSLCSQKFSSNADLIAHKSVHNSESFICKMCEVAFSDHCDYLLHKLSHSIQSRFTCPECGLKYHKQSYKLHIWTHFDKKFNCPECSYVGNGEMNLQSHINQKHVHNKTCVECGRVFHNTQNLEYHMISHTGVKRFQCFYCGKCFGGAAARKLHTRLHSGEKPYTCDICGHKSAQSNDMKRHKTTHETEKKYACDLCPKKYFYKAYLVIHMRSHTQESLYECPECDGKFVNPSGLKTHYMFKHLTERPVECSVCNKNFINNNQFRKHARSKKHKRNMYGHMMNSRKGNE